MQVSFWEKHSFYSHKDVIIVGAGLAGLWSALELHKRSPALKILIIERGMVPQGASTRNAGFACFGSPTELLHDAETMGEDKMWEIVEMRYKGIEKIRRSFGDDAIDFDNCGGYELLDAANTPAGFDEKLHWLNAGLKNITSIESTYIKRDNLTNDFKFNKIQTIIENKSEGGIHSGKLVQGLTKKVLENGIEIIYSTTVNEWIIENTSIKIVTDKQVNFTGGKLLFCTNAFTPALVKGVDVTPGRGQILLTSPIPGLPFTGTFHYNKGFYYFRNLGNRVLLGGARNKAFDEETTTVMETSGIIQNELERFLQEYILPGRAFTIEQRWSGIMAFTGNQLPIAMQVEPGVYTLVACNGMGVALTPIMAEKMAEMVLGS
jgi:gamma-glutamylputrescine oxidase